ncbi:MAG: S1/P1 nuclease, partial [Terriglobia bacterium]
MSTRLFPRLEGMKKLPKDHKKLTALLLVFLAGPRLGWAWGNRGHQIINRAAVQSLPQPLRAWFQARVEYLVTHGSDPDLLAHNDPEERPHHYTDADAYDRFPFARLRQQFVIEHRPPTASEMRQGTAIWEIDTFTRRLEEDFRARRWKRANHDALFMAHYAGDITQPLHTVANFDGQATGQRGVHSRFESELVNTLADRWRLRIAPAAEIPNLDARIFDEYVRSYAQAAVVFAADRKAVSGLNYFDPRYFSRFCALAGPLAEKRL